MDGWKHIQASKSDSIDFWEDSAEHFGEVLCITAKDQMPLNVRLQDVRIYHEAMHHCILSLHPLVNNLVLTVDGGRPLTIKWSSKQT